MNKMKSIYKIMIALAVMTIIGSSVVACSDPPKSGDDWKKEALNPPGGE